MEEDYITLPRGCEDAVVALLESNKITYRIEDKTNHGENVTVRFKGEFREEQKAAIASLTAHDNGVLNATTAFGKTVTAIGLLAERKVNTLILVHTKALLDQWKSRLEEFLEIDWNAKETLLAGGSIDLIWNGLTITDSRLQEMSLSVPYLKNRQVALAMSNNAEKYGDIESLKDAIAGAEDGSAGEEQIELKGIGKEYVKCESQLDAYNKLKTGTLDVIVIDSVMANYYISLEK